MATQEKFGVTVHKNPGGPDIATTGAKILEKDGLFFKDLAGTGELLPYEDWRLDIEERAKDLAGRLSIEEIAGLMLYSPHQMVPAGPHGPFPGTYGGKTLEESGAAHWELTDQQKNFIERDHVRHILAMVLENAETAAKWSNRLQSFAESLPWGIPVNISSDPRHGSSSAGAEYKSGAGDVSKWPEGLGMAATFSPELCREFGKAVSEEYRAMGITTALFPQVDLATEPRWMRFEDTFGAHPDMVADMSRAYCDSLQTTENSPTGWGKDSLCAMAKHWPGGGPCEGGRDAHYPFGKFAVYPGNNLSDHLKPFLEGVFRLEGPTGRTSAIMPYYTVSWGLDQKNGKNVGNSYSEYLIRDLLREKYGYDGVVCTDWGITADPSPEIDSFSSRCYGVEDLSEAERHLLAIENGVDQFGGNSAIAPILEAYEIGCRRHGEAAMRKRMEESAVRLLRNIFRCGLFENPYLDPAESVKTTGCEAFCQAGYQAQLKSLVLVKNQGALPQRDRKKVFIPARHIGPMKAFFRSDLPAQDIQPISRELVEKYYDWAETPEEADFALVFIESPLSDGYSQADRDAGGNGYVPISLQYRPYRADAARKESIAGGDFREDFTNRSYKGKTGTAANEADLDLVLNAKRAMRDKPVIVVLRMHKPTVPAEFEPSADAILVDFGVQSQAILDLVSGRAEPSGLLPVQMPANMDTVERHCEDVPLDMEPYRDSAGNVYDFAFGLNWNGVISDGRARRYPKP
ncbi:glycoside hydrolase family 3 protein [Acutalibacter sp. 1XD8-33]|uniref:glycoside hydrolase family 3 protein n=1 Tax=Acutalibacter sp. 1XD8-33 TaxID=2320081 RepID=UPI000EA09A4C|nr:glycoside hydrolase family 3 N-terminal domain-containing protein [Acutalibacter sp. 1XD8-33]RKJ41319.1 glycoside hydrolase family 3 protein [Acutalibacter sp. 1XD8-33]